MRKLRVLTRIDPGHPASKRWTSRGPVGCLPEFPSPCVRDFSAGQQAAFWWSRLSGPVPTLWHLPAGPRSVSVRCVRAAVRSAQWVRGEPELTPVLWGLLGKSVGRVPTWVMGQACCISFVLKLWIIISIQVSTKEDIATFTFPFNQNELMLTFFSFYLRSFSPSFENKQTKITINLDLIQSVRNSCLQES